MKTAPAVLFAVANELADQAKASLPKLRSDERVLKEWLDEGIYYRETSYKGETFQYQYDFRQRKSRQVAVVNR